MKFEPEMLADLPSVCGEGPLWHVTEKRVYWVDIPPGKLYRFDPATGVNELCHHDRPIGGYTLQADGSLLLFRDRGNVVVWRDGQIVRTVIEEIPDLVRTRFNDVCADPAGRVFCGTMAIPGASARLYRLDCDGTLTLLGEGYGTSNGMGFSPDERLLYFNDSGTDTPCTHVFDYVRATGALSNRRVLRAAVASGDPGRPDGLAVDAQGFVWTARWDGSALLRHSPDGAVVDTLPFPVRKVSSLCFAGEGLRDIYATTAGGGDRAANGAHAGALFRIRGYPVAGLARPVSRIGL
jgi:sugar lactone lactonase YvrE